jgi:hypothetical protein
MKKVLSLFVLAAVLLQGCKNPLAGVKLYVRNNFYNYTVTVSIKDAAQPTVSLNNVVITVSGNDAASIYARDGTQKFTVVDGTVDFSVIPTTMPTAQTPLSFIVNISGAAGTNYIPVTKVVTITPDQTNQRFTVRMINASGGDVGGVGVGSRSINMTGGGLSKPGYSGARTTGGASDDTLDKYNLGVYLPQGTSFYYYMSPSGQMTGTKPSVMTHDSTLVMGMNPVLYRPVTGYYQEEAAYIPSTYTKTAYTGSSITMYYLYRTQGTPPATIYNFPGGTNSINLLNGTPGVAENSLIFQSALDTSILAVYFVGTVNGQTICLSPYPNANPDSDWYFSYRIPPGTVNPMTSVAYAAGDQIEAGIAYLPGTYPIVPTGGTFTPTTLSTIHETVRMAADGTLRVDCQSNDVGIYAKGTVTPFSFGIDATVDTNYVPDPENVFADANVSFSIGKNNYSFDHIISPNISETISGSICAATALSLPSGTVNVYYWDSLVKTMPLTSGTNTVFAAPYITGNTYFPATARFYYTFQCSASGTPRIVEPTFNGTLHGWSGGKPAQANCNIVSGYWKTRGFRVGYATGDSIYGNACGHIFSIAPVLVKPFNYGQIENDNICTCYFHF